MNRLIRRNLANFFLFFAVAAVLSFFASFLAFPYLSSLFALEQVFLLIAALAALILLVLAIFWMFLSNRLSSSEDTALEVAPQVTKPEPITTADDTLRKFQHIVKSLNRDFDMPKILQAVLQTAVDYTEVDRCALFLLDAQKQNLGPVMHKGRGTDFSQAQFPLNQSPFQEVVDSKQILCIIDTGALEKFAHPQDFGKKGLLAVPLLAENEVIGVLACDNDHSGRALPHNDFMFLEMLAEQAAIALHNSRLYTKLDHYNSRLQMDVDKATHDIQKLLRQKSEFLKIASHQLRTPMAIARGNLSLLVEEPKLTTVERQQFIRSAYEGMNRLERVIHRLLYATEVDGGFLALNIKSVNIYDFIHRSANAFLPLAGDRGLKLKVRYFGPVTTVRTDPDRLYEALGHVIENAVHYTESGSVHVTAQVSLGQVIIHVRDTGIGVDAEQLPLVFTKFYRSENVWGMYPNGSGLGLYIAQQIMQALGGTITAASDGLGRGSEFVLTLPRT